MLEVLKVKKIHIVWVLEFVTSGSTTYTKVLLNRDYEHHTDFRKLSHRATQRQSTFALTPSVATTSTVCAKGYAAGAKGCAAAARAQRAEKY